MRALLEACQAVDLDWIENEVVSPESIQLVRDAINAAFGPDPTTGGPAYPAMEIRTSDTQDLVANASQGVTVRDYFAAKAMQGDLAAQSEESGYFSVGMTNSSMESCARMWFRIADTMLKVRSE